MQIFRPYRLERDSLLSNRLRHAADLGAIQD
jgi:hypothetical protein